MYIHVYPMNLPFSLGFIERVYARANCSPSTPTPWLRTSGAGVDLPNTGGISMEFPVDFLRIPTPNGHSIRNQPAPDLASQGPSLVQPVIKPASTHHETAKHFWNHDFDHKPYSSEAVARSPHPARGPT